MSFKTLLATGLVTLLVSPAFGEEPPQTCISDLFTLPGIHLAESPNSTCGIDTKSLEQTTIPVPSSCNGWEGSQRQARLEYDGSASGYDFFILHMDCLPEPAAWTFIDFYDPFTGEYGGSVGQNSDHVNIFFEEGDQVRTRMIVSSYDDYNVQTGEYGNLIGSDQILRFTSMDVPPLIDDTDGGDNPHIAGYMEVDDWTGHRFWPDYAIDDHNMVEMYRRGTAHIQDETSCEQVTVNGQPGQYWQWPAVCTDLFRDGFESSDTGAWDSHTE